MATPNCLTGCIGSRVAGTGKGVFGPYEDPIMAPWVVVKVADESWHLSMGNASSAANEAQIKSFSFGISNGLGVKIEVVDEAGGQFYNFFTRVNHTNRADSDKTITFQWGYVGESTSGQITNYESPSSTISSVGGCGVSSVGGSLPPLPNPNVDQYVSHIHTLFIYDIECHANTGNVFKYTINAGDMNHSIKTAVDNRTFGSEKNPIPVTTAIQELFKPYEIPVDFVSIDASGNRTPLLFFVPPNAAATLSQINPALSAIGGGLLATAAQISACGPAGKWNAGNQSPIVAAMRWINECFTTDNRGIIRFWEDIPGGQRLVFARSSRNPEPAQAYEVGRTLGTYLVNSGVCTPVLSFQPNFKYIFQQVATGAVAVPPSGAMPAVVGPNEQKSAGLNAADIAAAAMSNLVNAGMSMQFDIGPRAWIWALQGAATYIKKASTLNNYANPIVFPIEAELKIQGNPAYEWTYLNIGYILNIVYMNPFRPKPNAIGAGGGLEWAQGSSSSNVLTNDSCNPILSNCNWQLMGVSHEIHDGAYYTILKVRLLNPGIDMPPGAPLGGCPGGFTYAN